MKVIAPNLFEIYEKNLSYRFNNWEFEKTDMIKGNIVLSNSAPFRVQLITLIDGMLINCNACSVLMTVRETD